MMLNTGDRSRLSHIAWPVKESIARQAAEEAAEAAGCRVADILGPSRARRISAIRDLAAFVAFREGASYAAIGRVMNRDHTSIMAAVQRERERRGEK